MKYRSFFIPSLLFLAIVFSISACARSPLAPLLPPPTCTNGGIVTTFAGTGGVSGSADGIGPAASFAAPEGVAIDSAGNIYVADSGNNTIRKITPGGVVTTLAGTAGVVGNANGIGPAASFGYPAGLAVDSAGNVYVGDNWNNLVRKITPGGVVTTLAGSGAVGSADGVGTAASFWGPGGIAVDPSGNVYVADDFNCLIRKITPGGVVTTLAGNVRGYANGIGTAASFSLDYPSGVALDSTGNLYVIDTANQVVRKIDTFGSVTTVAGSAGVTGSTNGVGTAATFSRPEGITLDSCDNIYIGDTFNNLIRKIDTAGVVTTLAGQTPPSFGGTTGFADGTGSAASFYIPCGLVVDSSGAVYVADEDNSLIRKIQ